MANPATLSNIMSLPDILDTARGFLYFPSIPGEGNAERLTLLGCNVSVPSVHIGHIRVPLFNHSIAFRGHRDHGNQFTASFYESRDAAAHYALMAWMAACCSSVDDTSMLKSEYSVTCFYDQLDTAGATAYRFRMTGVWPQTFSTPASSENSSPSRIEATFSVDFVDLIAAGNYLGQGYGTGDAMPLESRVYGSTDGMNLASFTPQEMGRFNNASNLNSPGIRLGLNEFGKLLQ